MYASFAGVGRGMTPAIRSTSRQRSAVSSPNKSPRTRLSPMTGAAVRVLRAAAQPTRGRVPSNE